MKKLEEMNNIEPEHLDGEEICDIKNIGQLIIMVFDYC